jgi:(4S)-4-hydroxy-5-phosphonooxypentane-2,3-dione isomerase
MYVVTVQFEVAPAHYAAFMKAMLANATASLELEEGCTQFDVCETIPAQSSVFLYEVYDNAQAFEAHLKTAHFLEFNALTQDWVTGKKVALFQRASAVGDAA